MKPNPLWAEVLACPHCHGVMRHDGASLGCASCDQRFVVSDGIPCFDRTDDFYDSYAEEHCPYAVSPSGFKQVILRLLPFWSWREWLFWRRAIPKGERLLDLGCGRGRQLFHEYASETVGYDSSLHFARDCDNHYTAVAVGRMPLLPFRSGAFGVVVSSHVMGHVAVAEKDTLVQEIARTLRPGGITAHVIETDSNHPAVVAAKTNNLAYREQFIDQHGHIGLEHVDTVIERFQRNGFQLRHRQLVDAVIPSVMNTRRFFNHPAFAGLPGLIWSRRLDRWTAHNRVANLAYEVGMGTFHRTIEQWIGKPDYAQFVIVAFEKVSTA